MVDMKNEWKNKEKSIFAKAEREIEKRYRQERERAMLAFKSEIDHIKAQYRGAMRDGASMAAIIRKLRRMLIMQENVLTRTRICLKLASIN